VARESTQGDENNGETRGVGEAKQRNEDGFERSKGNDAGAVLRE